jgi:PhnB protein
MRASVNLTFDGGCAEAFALYARLLGATITFALRYADSPMAAEVPASWGDKIAHATLTLADGSRIYGSDAAPGRYEAPRGFAMTADPATADEARAVFEALADGGRVDMPIQQTFWAAAFGLLVDRFGIPWAINCEQPPPSA